MIDLYKKVTEDLNESFSIQKVMKGGELFGGISE
jgi:hypothetical protein